MNGIQITELLTWITNQWGMIPKQYMILMYFGGMVFAFLNCFMGYRLRKVWGCLLGVLVGGGIGITAGYFILQDKFLALLCGLGGAFVLGLLALLLYKFGVFFMCTGLVYFLGLNLFQELTMKHHMIALIIGIFAGTLALGYEAQMVIGITSICGGIGGIHLMMRMLEKDAGAGKLILGLIIAAIGIAVQSAPLLKGKDWEANLFHLPARKKKGKTKVKKTKKVVKKTEVQKVVQPQKRSTTKTKQDYDKDKVVQDTIQEDTVGQKQYEQQNFYPGSGIGIDLDDLNRELSHEIQKIYDEEQDNN